MAQAATHTTKRPHTPRATRRRAGSVDKWIGFEIGRMREERKFSRIDLGLQLGLSHQQIAKYETGASRVAISTFLNIAEALEIRPEEAISRILDIKRQFCNEAPDTTPSPARQPQ